MLGKRAHELTKLICRQLGDKADDPLVAAAAARAGEISALAEHLRGKMLRGERVSYAEVMRASRTADLLTRRLYRDAPPKPVSLDEYLARKKRMAP